MDTEILLTGSLEEVSQKEDGINKMIPIIYDLNFVLVNSIGRGLKLNSKFMHASWPEMHCDSSHTILTSRL